MMYDANELLKQCIEGWREIDGSTEGLLGFKIELFIKLRQRMKAQAQLTNSQLALAISAADLYHRVGDKSSLAQLRFEMEIATYLNSCS